MKSLVPGRDARNEGAARTAVDPGTSRAIQLPRTCKASEPSRSRESDASLALFLLQMGTWNGAVRLLPSRATQRP